MFKHVGFALEGNVSVSIATVNKEFGKPFNEVPQIEKHIQQFFHLPGVNLFVIQKSSPNHVLMFFADEEHAEEIDGNEAFEWEVLGYYRFHFRDKR